ncbi:MAG TPA: glycosyltransferase family 4 protein [Bacteroidales bacterium]|nr:glycosyltransferase family 4 protein [Bacteroidales bacterium]
MKRVLIITYYWIPSGGAGVQRWVKFVKYLREFGWEPIVYTPENPEYPSEDHSFVKDIPQGVEVLKTPIWEPYDIYRKLTGRKGEKINAGFILENKKSGWKDKLSIWIRGNFLIPDPRRFWVKPSVKYLTDYLKENPVDAIVSTGPPHSMHLIGLGLKKQFPNLPWIADFRDPWTNIDFYADLNLTSLADKIHHKLERKVIQSADCVLVVSSDMKREYHALNPKRIELITNGYDTDDVEITTIEPDKKFSLSHIGTLNAARNSKTLWKILGELSGENVEFAQDLQINLIGKTDFSVIEEAENNGLTANLNKIDYVSHSEAVVLQKSSQILLLLINNSANAKGILTGKFFEYLAAKRPILAIGPTDGDVAKVLEETSAGVIVDFEDEVKTKELIKKFYNKFKTENLEVSSKSIEKYSRKALTKQLAEVLDGLKK